MFLFGRGFKGFEEVQKFPEDVNDLVAHNAQDPHALQQLTPEDEFRVLLFVRVHDVVTKEKAAKEPFLPSLQVDRLNAEWTPETWRQRARFAVVLLKGEVAREGVAIRRIDARLRLLALKKTSK